ncbi:MAG: O-antigen ligase family protein [Phycisphaerales bacterium]
MPTPRTTSKLSIDQRFDYSFRTLWRDEVAKRCYLAAGILLCCCAVGPMTAVEVGGLAAAAFFFGCLVIHYRTLPLLLREPLPYLLILWAAWLALSSTWSLDPHKGWWEFRSLRFSWFVLVLWPLMAQRRHLIFALCAGFLLSNAAQGVLAFIRLEGWTAWDFSKNYPDRNAGWWVHPAICGYMLVAALGLHLPAALWGRARARWFGVAGVVATWAGMFATGTRGAWVGGVVLTLIGLGIAWRRAQRHGNERRRFRRTCAGVIGVGLCVVLAGGTSHRVRERVQETAMEVRRVVVEHDLNTWSGSRIRFAQWAIDMIRERPLIGFGAGSFEPWVRCERPDELAASAGVDGQPHIAPMAHNLWLHAWATLGLPGLVMTIVIAYVVLRGGLRGTGNPLRPASKEPGGDRRATKEANQEATQSPWSVYDAGPGLALVGLLLTTPFDVLYVNSPPSALFAVLAGLCLWQRPREAPMFRM